ncbi:MAG: beta-N-acetylhexosaminidase [Clostridia bacterium]|nr:beta-N-acetylhexosaminidase [Clostridia bacterium]
MLPIIPKPQEQKILSDKTYTYTLADVREVRDDSLPKSGYALTIDDGGIRVKASDDDGFYYAKVTIQNLMELGELPNVEVCDYPRYAYRGYMLDCARHYHSLDAIKKIIDAVARFKINVFHWHLTDDQGWRVQIDKYPLLTELASYRDGTRGDGKPVHGYYTKDEMSEIVEYCKQYHMDVLPEFDVPGHTAAAISVYPELDCFGSKIEVKDSFGIHPEVLCAGKERSVEFCKDVLKEMFEIFPFHLIHLGGDEALRLHWLDCPDCQREMAENGLKNEDELQAHFMAKLARFCLENGKTVINWNDGMVGENVDDSIVVHYWQSAPVNKVAAIREINRGKKGIISPFFSYYLDYPYGMTPLKKTFAFNPEIEGVEKTENILGVEAPLWSEYVKSEEDIHRQTFPRILAVAERGWSAYHDDYKDFLARVKYNYKIIDNVGIRCVTINDTDPNPIKKVVSLLKFFGNAWDKTQILNRLNVTENKIRLRKKYGK